MGNAMDFLNDKDNRDLKRKGNHHAKCKVKIDKYLEENETTKCEDYCIIQSGVNRKNHRVNEMQIFVGTIDGIHARMYEKRKPKPCQSCGDPFKPVRLRRPARVAESEQGIGEYTIWCPNTK